jgi:hypothetical protein
MLQTYFKNKNLTELIYHNIYDNENFKIIKKHH